MTSLQWAEKESQQGAVPDGRQRRSSDIVIIVAEPSIVFLPIHCPFRSVALTVLVLQSSVVPLRRQLFFGSKTFAVASAVSVIALQQEMQAANEVHSLISDEAVVAVEAGLQLLFQSKTCLTRHSLLLFQSKNFWEWCNLR